jgi:two-component system NtrC family sensor kinase
MAWADAVLDLPGLCPAAASLAALALERDVASARRDPGAVLFLARQHVRFQSPEFPALDDASLLAALELVEHGRLPFVDWRRPGLDRVWRASQFMAAIAEALALKVGVGPTQAFAAALLAPLGWFGICAATPDRIPTFLEAVNQRQPDWQKAAWGLDHAALTRRLVRAWRLPDWLADVVGHLDWNADLVTRLGVDANLVAVVQLAVLAAQKTNLGLGLVVGSTEADLLERLNSCGERPITREPDAQSEGDRERTSPWSPSLCASGSHASNSTTGLTSDVVAAIAAQCLREDAVPALESPYNQPLLADVLRLTLENRQRREKAWIEQLNRDVDRLEGALAQQIADEAMRLGRQKLVSLAEFAAGAGHEINNPLAVISGQAQYILKQMNWVEELLLEDPTPAAVFEAVKAKLTKPLQTIVGQSQRIHQVITDLMFFARPQTPRPTMIPAAKLIAEAVQAVRGLADERKVRIVCPEVPAHLGLRVDAQQIRLALSNLLRNGIEAASAEGWTSLRLQRESNGDIAFAIEDNGAGVADHQREHLFDPFYSGRSAGRGRGLGLSTAWRLARQHGGDVRLDHDAQGVTRFLLTLPASDVIDNYVPTPGGKRDPVGYQLSGVG